MMATSEWNPDTGFYKTRAMQGSDDWAENARFDPPAVPSDDPPMGAAGGTLSIGDLTAPASYDQGDSEIYGC